MNEKGIRRIVIILIIGFVLVVGQMNTFATETDIQELSETEDATAVKDQEEKKTEVKTEVSPAENITKTVSDEEESADNKESEKEEDLTSEEDMQENLEKLAALAEYDEGLVYYLKKYAYDSKASYLEKYVDFLDKQAEVCEEMFALGEVTEVEVSSLQAQCSSIKAELTVTQNESSYYNLYLEKNELDYSDYSTEESKDVYDIDYYTEKYPKKNYMTIARYVTDYNNAVAYMEAKKIEMEALEKSISMLEMLYKEGEISELELLEKKVLLAKIEYEMVQYNIDRNIAYYSLGKICE